MGAAKRTDPARAVIAVLLGLVVMTGCTGSTDPPPREAVPTASASTAPSAPTATRTEPSRSTPPPPAPSSIDQAAPETTYVPPGMDWLPPDEELDRLVAEAEQAYRAHWTSYDAAIQAGFRDPELLDALLATAGEATLEALYLQVAAIGDTGRFAEGGSVVLGMAHVGLDPPAADGESPSIVFDTCVHTRATLKEPDGTTVRELSGPEPNFLRVHLVQRAGSWLVTSQTQHGSPCPEPLVAQGGDGGGA